MSTILGVDLTSTGGVGLCALPLGWDLDWSRVVTLRVDVDAAQSRGAQLTYLTAAVRRFATEHQAQSSWIEGYLTARAYNVTKLAELGGAVRLTLWRDLALDSHMVPLSSARKLLFGSVPRGATKADYHEQLAAMGAPTARWSHDEADAFVVANYGSAELGGCTLAAPPPVKATRKRRAAA